MESKNYPITVEHFGIIFVTQYSVSYHSNTMTTPAKNISLKYKHLKLKLRVFLA